MNTQMQMDMGQGADQTSAAGGGGGGGGASFADDFSGDLSKWDSVVDAGVEAGIVDGAWQAIRIDANGEASIWAKDSLPEGASEWTLDFDIIAGTNVARIYFAWWCDEAARGGTIEDGWAAGRVGYLTRPRQTILPQIYTLQATTIIADAVGTGWAAGDHVQIKLVIAANGDRTFEWRRNTNLIRQHTIEAASLQAGLGLNWGLGLGLFAVGESGGITNVVTARS